MKTELVKLTKDVRVNVAEDTQFVLDFSNLETTAVGENLSLELVFDKPGVSAELIVLFKLGARGKLGLTTVSNHTVPNTSCQTNIKGVLLDDAQSVYTGKILIAKKAQQTNSFLTDAVLVVGEGTKNQSNPILEIEADDVRASHGATTGRINENQLYYLQSRGLDREEAEKLVMEGFFESVLSKIADESIKKSVAQSLGL